MGPEDADDLYDAVLSRAGVMRWQATGVPGSREDARLACEAHAVHWERHGLGDFAVRDRACDAFLGRVGFRCRPEHGTDLGFAVSPDAQGRGVAAEAGAACLAFAWDTTILDEVVAFALPDNDRSVALLLGLGAREAGQVVSSGNLCRRFRIARPTG